MKFKLTLIPLLFVFISGAVQAREKPAPDQVAHAMQRVADWQIAHFRDKYSHYDQPHDIGDWTNAAFYFGLLKWSDISSDGRYANWLKGVADRADWRLLDRTYMADDHAVGQLYLDLYRRYGDKRMLTPTKQRLDYLLSHPSDEPLSIDDYTHFERWTWCDALFMAPPVWAKMTTITGDRRYLDWMLGEFKASVAHLYDADESLFYRDGTFLDKRVNGKKVFWARGNGWVFAGLTSIMNELPRNSAEYAYFLGIYKHMAAKLLSIQTADGYWAMSLLDAEAYPAPETSGTSFFAYGLAWGINRGILTEDKYRQSVFKAWKAVASRINEDGMLGYVQPIGAAPGQAWADQTEVYGAGAFLAAGSEIYRLVGGASRARIAYSKALGHATSSSNAILDNELKVAQDPTRPKVFARFVPERTDDFAWENDVVAFRAYGPALRDAAENSGIDCWLKRVKYPIIDKWYAQDIRSGISYHEDHGEGLDDYHVGPSAGDGGTAIWIDGRREPLETYTRYSIQDATPGSVTFTLTYGKTINNDDYREDKRITLKLGSRLFSVESTFRKNGVIADDLPVAIGVTTHDGKASAVFDQHSGWLSAWENLDGFGLGTGIVVDPHAIVETVPPPDGGTVKSDHALYIVRTDKRGKVFYFAGYGWEAAKEITTAAEWQDYLAQFSQNYQSELNASRH